MTNTHSYQDPIAGKQYASFANSEDGKFQQQTLLEAISPHLPTAPAHILDAGCGTGWLTKALSDLRFAVKGCDVSDFLLAQAKQKNPNIPFELCDLNTQQPFQSEHFDCIVANMVVHDLRDQIAGFTHFTKSLKDNGKLIITIPNPYYTYPLGDWKRQRLGRLFGEKPRLQLNPYRKLLDQSSKFTWGDGVPAYWYPLDQQISNALKANLTLIGMHDILAKKDSVQFNLNYRLYRFPLFLMLIFKNTIKDLN